MSVFACATLAQNLHDTNARIRFWLESVNLHLAEAQFEPRVATPQQMTGLLSELLRAGEWLRRLPNERHPELELELKEYRRTVERLHQLLPSIHGALLRERSRLEQERARVEAAAEWARRSHQTL